jgi:hypothetical protein
MEWGFVEHNSGGVGIIGEAPLSVAQLRQLKL